MDPSSNSIEAFWDAVLSRVPDQIRHACADLLPADLERLLTHLREMTTGEGWLPEQRRSAQAALEALTTPGENPPPE